MFASKSKSAALLALTLIAPSPAQAEAPVQTHDAHAHHAPPPVAAPPASDSLYQLTGTFHDEQERPFKLASLEGKPALIVMFYGTCKTICPLLIEQARQIDLALPPEERSQLRVVLVTLDAERDTPERLRALAAERKLELPRWTLLRGSDGDVRELAMALGVQYRKLDSGDYAHTALVTLLDRSGRVAGRVEGLGKDATELVAKARQLAASPPTASASGR